MNRIKKHFAKRFSAGLLILIPIGLSWLVLKKIAEYIDGILQPVATVLIGYEIPGAGIALTVIIIYLIGLIVANVLGKKVIDICLGALGRIPLVNTIYSPIKKMAESMSGENSQKAGFNKVVLAEFPRKGVLSLGIPVASIQRNGKPHALVYFPTAPMPQSGPLALFPEEDLEETPLTVKEFMALIVSIGLKSPAELNSPEEEGTSEE